MRLIHCLFTMEAAGAQVLTVGLLNEMCISNEVVLIVVNSCSGELMKELDARVKIHYLHRKEGDRSLKPLIRLNLLLRHYNADIIHCHEPDMVKIIRWKKKAKLFHTVHDMGISASWYKKYDCLIAISVAVYWDVIARCTKPVVQIDNGVSVAAFRRRTDYAAVTDGPVRLVQISRLLHEKKGQDILLAGLSHIIEEHGFTNWTLDLVGAGASETYLRKLIAYLRLEGRVNLVGGKSRDWIQKNLCEYHILIQPSRYEGFGLTVVEGLTAGLSVLASDIDGPKEIIDATEGGLLFKNGDITDCGNQLHRLLMIWRSGGAGAALKNSIARVEAKYSMASCATQYMSAYQNAVYAVA